MDPVEGMGAEAGRPPLARRTWLAGAGASAAGLASGLLRPRRGSAQAPTLRIAQWAHPVPAYDEWLDQEFAPAWGQKNGVTVAITHLWAGDLRDRALNEAATGRGHDLFGLPESTPSLERFAAPLNDVVTECERRFGKMVAPVQRATYNPVTRTYFALCDAWSPAPLHVRTDLWAEAGVRPDAWDRVREGARRIRERHGIIAGLGLSPEPDSEGTLRALLWAHGAAEQDEAGRVTLASPGAVEAVKLVVALYREAMGPEVLAWDPSSNNRAYVWGKASLIQNAVVACRSAEQQHPAVARQTTLLGPPAGPRERLAPVGFLHGFLLWKFSRQGELARRFLVDLVAAGEAAFRASLFVGVPAFPRAAGDLRAALAADRAQPGRYALLAEADRWSASPGYPGFLTPSVEEAMGKAVISSMFARAARGESTPEDAVRRADAELRRIAARWQK